MSDTNKKATECESVAHHEQQAERKDDSLGIPANSNRQAHGNAFHFTKFESLDASGPLQQYACTWPEFVTAMLRGGVKEIANKDDTWLWAPVKLINDKGRRCDENVESIHAVSLDFDDLTDEQTEAVLAALKGREYLLHTTHSNGALWRFRVVLPLTRPVQPAEFAALWLSVAKSIPHADQQCKDVSRCMYRPSCAIGATGEIMHEVGAWLDPDSISPAPLPAPNATTPAPTATAPGLSDDAIIRAGELLAHFVQDKGQRHQRALCIGGALARMGLPDDDVEGVAYVAFQRGGSTDPDGRAKDALDSARNARAGKATMGIPELVRMVGDPTVTALRRILGVSQQTVEAPVTGDNPGKRLIDDLEDSKGLIRPDGYEVDGNARLCAVEFGKEEPESVPVLNGDLIILAEVAHESTRIARIAFRGIDEKKGRQWTTRAVPIDLLVNSRKAVELANYGVQVSEQYAKRFAKYCSDYRAANEKSLQRPVALRGGWHGEGFKCFVLGDAIVGGDNSLRAEVEDKDFAASIGTKGDRETHLAALRAAVTRPALGFSLAASFAAPMVRPLNRSTVGANFSSVGGKGKTRNMKIAGSIWGATGGARDASASGFISGSDSTIRALEPIARARQDLPLMIADVQPQKGLLETLHNIVNGTPRHRCDTKGKEIVVKPFHCGAVMFEGEFDAEGSTNRQGFRRRFLELEPDTDPNKVTGEPDKVVSEIYKLAETLSENYGFAGRSIVEALVKEGDFSKWCLLADEYQCDATTKFGDADRAGLLATLRVAIEYACKVLEFDDETRQKWHAGVIEVVNRKVEQLKEDDQATQEERAAEDLSRLLVEIDARIARDQESTNHPAAAAGGWLGYREGDGVVVMADWLRKALASCGHTATKAVIAALGNKGMIQRLEKKRMSGKKRIGHCRVQCYQVVLSE